MEGERFCKDCRWCKIWTPPIHDKQIMEREHRYGYSCISPLNKLDPPESDYDPVTGELLETWNWRAEYCEDVRGDHDGVLGSDPTCGPEGKWFEANG